jgi:hypothetical protein
VKQIQVDAVGEHDPVRVDVTGVGTGRRGRHGDEGVKAVGDPLQPLAEDAVYDRVSEVGMDCAHNRTIRFVDGQQRERGRKGRVHVHHVVRPGVEYATHLNTQAVAQSEPRVRAVGVDRHAAPNANNAGLA